jgi:hypothetical protein
LGLRFKETPEKVTQYALETKHGIFDPQHGLGSSGNDVIPKSDDDLEANVTV